jgi:hypothetical protein
VGKSVGRSAADIETAAKRDRLPARKNPHWKSVAGTRGGLSLGYRKRAQGAGAWVAKLVISGNRREEAIGRADDDPQDVGAVKYRDAVQLALVWAKQQAAALDAMPAQRATYGELTVAAAIEAYVAGRKRRAHAAGRDAEARLAKHVTAADPELSGLTLRKLRAVHIQDWRARLAVRSPEMALATVNRLMNDLRAALNAAVELHRRELPAAIEAEIRVGTRAEPAAGEARRQLLSDAQVRSLIEAAFEVDPSGDFGRLVLLAAATGARFSQVAAIRAGDLQSTRVLVPGSRKGRSTKRRAAQAVPLSAETVKRLEAIVLEPDAPLLTRRYSEKGEGQRWRIGGRREWRSSFEIRELWARACKAADLPPGTIMYALRHSSIVRGLRAGLPIRLVAAIHDTSVAMIERHYSAFILDMAEDLARRAVL